MALDVELAEVRDFLAAHPPFDELPPAVLASLPPQLSIEYRRRGSAVIGAGRGDRSLYVVRSGAVDVVDSGGRLVDRGGVGTCVGSATLLGANPSGLEATAIEDCLLLVMPAEVFYRLTLDHAGFAAFFDSQRAHRMKGALELQQMSVSGGAILKTHVRDLLQRRPVTATADASVREAAATMADNGISSLLIVDGDRLVGIVTDRDLRSRVLATGVDPSGPVGSVMTADPVTGTVDALASEVLLEMVARNIHHLPIIDEGRPVGVVTATDLMRLEHSNPVYLVGDVGKQPDVAGVAATCATVPAVVEVLVSLDASADDIGRVVTAVGDAVDRRLLALAEERLGPPPVPYCWVTLGSRARREQALAADQDHALIVSDEATDDHAAYFEALAGFVADALVECGYPPCPGGYMATNPSLRRTLSQWRGVFLDWMARPDRNAVLQASVFLDMRPVHGETALFEGLSSTVRRAAPRSPAFLGELARYADEDEPPLGFFRGFVVEKEGMHKDALDVKHGGIEAVVELARVFAVSLGSGAVETSARIDAAVEAHLIGAERGEDLRDAFEFLSYVRLRHQVARFRAGAAPDSFIDPDDLGAADRRHLREAFGIIRDAQTLLAHRFPVVGRR